MDTDMVFHNPKSMAKFLNNHVEEGDSLKVTLGGKEYGVIVREINHPITSVVEVYCETNQNTGITLYSDNEVDGTSNNADVYAHLHLTYLKTEKYENPDDSGFSIEPVDLLYD